MAIFHVSLKTYSRAKGRSSVAAAAYRAGVALTDDRTGLRHDYSRRRGVECVRILAPGSAPAWARDVSKLWNAAEAAEKRSNARTARELIVALPHELSAEQRQELAETIGRLLVERYSVAAMVAVHAPDARGDQRSHHTHILFTTRALSAEGFGAKVRCLDDRDQGPREIESLRRAVADLMNAALAAAGSPERVDARSLRAQARAAEDSGDFARAAMLTREPTEHVGPVETAAARRGQGSERVAANAAKHASHRTALATFLRRAEAEGRLMPAATDRRPRAAESVARAPRRRLRPSLPGISVLGGPVRGARATGQGAEVLNAQAAAAEEGARVARENAQIYLDQVKTATERYGEIVEAYLTETGRSYRRDRLLAECAADARCADLLRQSTEARRALRALRAEIPERRRRYGQAMAATAVAQRDVDAVEAEKPSVWRPMTRRRWADKRRAQRAALVGAERAEHEARRSVGFSSTQKFRVQEQSLRANIRRAETMRRALCSPGRVPPPSVRSRAHPFFESSVRIDAASQPHLSSGRRADDKGKFRTF